MPAKNLQSLPQNVMSQIIGKLSVRNRARVQATSRNMGNIVRASGLLSGPTNVHPVVPAPSKALVVKVGLRLRFVMTVIHYLEHMTSIYHNNGVHRRRFYKRITNGIHTIAEDYGVPKTDMHWTYDGPNYNIGTAPSHVTNSNTNNDMAAFRELALKVQCNRYLTFELRVRFVQDDEYDLKLTFHGPSSTMYLYGSPSEYTRDHSLYDLFASAIPLTVGWNGVLTKDVLVSVLSPIVVLNAVVTGGFPLSRARKISRIKISPQRGIPLIPSTMLPALRATLKKNGFTPV